MVEANKEEESDRSMIGKKRQRNKVTASDLMDLSALFSSNSKRSKVQSNSTNQQQL